MTATAKRRNASRKGRKSWAWYDKLSNFNVESLFAKKREPGPRRTVFLNEGLPEDYYDKKGRVKKEHIYVTNQVITSKYTFITFLPRNLLEQFRRIANMYVLAFFVRCPSLNSTLAFSLGSLFFNSSTSFLPFLQALLSCPLSSYLASQH